MIFKSQCEALALVRGIFKGLLLFKKETVN